MIESVASTVIAKPVGEVFAFIANPENVPAWARGTRMLKLPAGAFGDGTLLRRRGVVMRVDHFAVNDGFETESVAIRPPASLILRHAHAALHFEPTDHGTRFTTVHQFELTLLARPLQRMLANAAQRNSQAAVERVKRLLERR